MTRLISISCIALSALSLYSCNVQEVNVESSSNFDSQLVLIASREGVTPDTKSIRLEDGSTWWNAAEEISVFYGSGTDGGSRFTSQNSELQEIVEFSGSVQMSGPGKEFWAVYPYSYDNECDGASITTIIPDVQTGSEGNFSCDGFPTIAKSPNNVFAFWNICGGIKFFVSRGDIKSLTFKGNGDETIAGKVRVSFNADGKPEVIDVLDGKSAVTLNAPDGGTFKAGKYYYLTLLPTVLDSGFTVILSTMDNQGVVSSDKTQVVKRSTFGVLKSIDSKVDKWESLETEYEWIDLGLSVKWASFNLGASSPEENGAYYAWGEIEPKLVYNWASYKWCKDGSSTKLTKYCTDPSYGDNGFTDKKIFLDAEDDAAKAALGGKWRMPLYSEWEELKNECYWKWETLNGVPGMKITSRKTGYEDKWIFLPASGFRTDMELFNEGSSGHYLSLSLNETCPSEKKYVRFHSKGVNYENTDRYYGGSIRPVMGDFVRVAGIELNKSSLQLQVLSSYKLSVNYIPTTVTERAVTWKSSNTDVVVVDAQGIVTGIRYGKATITATTVDGGYSSKCIVEVDPYEIASPEMVDLGLSVKWASFNLGASSPEGYGAYYAWGETTPKSDYSWSTYKWCKGSEHTITKYCSSPSEGYNGFTDNRTVLLPEDDASFMFNNNWRMPTHDEISELINNCTCTRTAINGVEGMKFTSNVTGYSDKWIFLPTAGYRSGTVISSNDAEGCYWSSFRDDAWITQISTGLKLKQNYPKTDRLYRESGMSVRPVMGDVIRVTGVTINRSRLKLSIGSLSILSATTTPSAAPEKSVTWESSDTDIVTVDSKGRIIGVSTGAATVTATTNDGGFTATCSVQVVNPVAPDAIDLGLSVKWASCNLGAFSPEEYGAYYAWGETVSKSDYSWSTYLFASGNKRVTKYNKSKSYGSVDNLTVLLPDDDAATVALGGNWRMPTREEMLELKNNCNWVRTVINGVSGYKITNTENKDNWIFLPAAASRQGTQFSTIGYIGYYWTSSLEESIYAYCLYFDAGSYKEVRSIMTRDGGCSIRPVYDNKGDNDL